LFPQSAKFESLPDALQIGEENPGQTAHGDDNDAPDFEPLTFIKPNL
jgi:hypothetical protein